MEKILLFQVKETEEIKMIAAAMHIKVIVVKGQQYKETLQDLYQDKPKLSSAFQGELPTGSLIVFCRLQEKKLDKMLAALRKQKITVDYKAVMTPANAGWNILRLYYEMEQEKKAYQSSLS